MVTTSIFDYDDVEGEEGATILVQLRLLLVGYIFEILSEQFQMVTTTN